MKAITVGAMKNALLAYASSQEEFDNIWFAFVTMTNVKIISDEVWANFYVSCRGWYVDEIGVMRDSHRGNKRVTQNQWR